MESCCNSIGKRHCGLGVEQGGKGGEEGMRPGDVKNLVKCGGGGCQEQGVTGLSSALASNSTA